MLTVLLCDADSDTELVDLSEYASAKQVSPRLSRPTTTSNTVAGDTPGLWATDFDGRPNLEVGRRTIKVLQDGVLRANTPVWRWDGSADENSSSIQITGIDPLIRTIVRLVQDDTGAFSDPVFPSPISGAEMLEAAFNNTIANDGPLPIDMSGPIASSTDLAADLTNWPIKLSDLITTLTATGALDLLLNPVDTHMGFPAGILGQLTAADRLGADRTGDVQFSFIPGDSANSIAKLRRSFDMSTMANKLWYFLGRRIDSRHYAGNITATETGLEDYAALQLASQLLYGVMMDAKIKDDNDDENSARKLWHRIWKTEVALRTKPRELLYITPIRGEASPYRPYIHYAVGDTIEASAGELVGPAFADVDQRVYGFDLSEAEDGVETVSELIVSLDGIGTIG